jgi:hypothetical protein
VEKTQMPKKKNKHNKFQENLNDNNEKEIYYKSQQCHQYIYGRKKNKTPQIPKYQ